MHVYRKVTLVLLLIGLAIAPAVAAETPRDEDPSCPEIVTQALEATTVVCDAASRNEACYGHVLLNAESQPDVTDFTFNQVGDLENVARIQSLRLNGMNIEEGVWGVALMRLRASLPAEDSTSNVTLLLFGEVEIANAVTQPTLTEITAPANVTVRSQPDLEGEFVANLIQGSTAYVDGRTLDNEWLHIQLPDTEQAGWVYTSVVMNPDDAQAFEVYDAQTRVYQPMQAFYFQSGMNDSMCPEAPDSGLLIQTPEGVAQVTFLINEVDIQLGSTVYFQADPGNEMIVTVVEGSAHGRAFGVTSTATAGSQFSIPIDDALQPSGPPGLPRAYDRASVNALPIQNLERPIEIADPLTEEEVEALVDEVVAENAEAPGNTGNIGDGDQGIGNDTPPIPGGGTENNPVFGDNTPNNGGEPPGQQN